MRYITGTLSPVMTSHCANPSCLIPLGYLREGRIFQFEVRPQVSTELPSQRSELSTARRISSKLHHFWLCGKCSSTLTLAFDVIRGVVIRPRTTA